MKRFKISYSIAGVEKELYAEPMDPKHRMFSLERQLMDPHPLLIERGENGWYVKSQDNWGLTDVEINSLGNKLDHQYNSRPQE